MLYFFDVLRARGPQRMLSFCIKSARVTEGADQFTFVEGAHLFNLGDGFNQRAATQNSSCRFRHVTMTRVVHRTAQRWASAACTRHRA
jgi:hypothetical protein